MSDIHIELRRDPPPDPEAVGEDAELRARIRTEIAERGPMTFARFMELALYEPGHGYYRRATAAPGREGDFLTSPEAHPIFGVAIARLAEQAWTALDRPPTFLLEEHGAGTGALAVAVLDALRSDASPLAGRIRYRPIEVEEARLATLTSRLERAGLADRLVTDDATAPDLILANEVVDALPVHRVVMRDRLLERFVTTTDGGFAEVDGEPSTVALEAHLADDGVRLAPGHVTEIPLAADESSECAVEAELPEIYFTADLKGYGWVFRKGSHVNIGLGRQDSHRLSDHVEDFLTFLRRRGRFRYGNSLGILRGGLSF